MTFGAVAGFCLFVAGFAAGVSFTGAVMRSWQVAGLGFAFMMMNLALAFNLATSG